MKKERQFYFTPDDLGAAQAMLDFINQAQKQIIICGYAFNCPGIINAIIARHQAGVNVQLVLDKTQSFGKTEAFELTRIKQTGMMPVVGYSDKHRIMHNKFLVVDSAWVEAGSLNFTEVAFQEDNFFWTEYNPELAGQFIKAFDNIRAWIVQNQA